MLDITLPTDRVHYPRSAFHQAVKISQSVVKQQYNNSISIACTFHGKTRVSVA